MSVFPMVTSEWPTPPLRKHLTEGLDRLVELTSALMEHMDPYVGTSGLKRMLRLPAAISLVTTSVDLVCCNYLLLKMHS